MSLITKRNKFPTEFLQKLTTHLEIKDCYNCLFVCRFWYLTFQRALLKKVYINSNQQLEQFLNFLQNSTFNNGHLIKELYLNTVTEEEEEQETVQLSQQQFEFINQFCPLLEVIQFDASQWKNINLRELVKWKQMRACHAPIIYSTLNDTLAVFGSKNLAKLHIQHSVDELEQLVDQLDTIPTIEDLTLEEIPLITIINNNNNNNNIPILSKQLEKITISLPKLKRINLIRNNEEAQQQQQHETSADNNFLQPFKQPCGQIKSLSLHGQVNSLKWFEFITKNYPSLTELKLTQFTTSRFGTKWMWQHALVQLIQSLPLLKNLTLGGRNIPQLFSSSLVKELNSQDCFVDNLYIDFQTYQAIESCQFLLLIQQEGIKQLKYLRLRVWEQIPGWSGVTRNLFQCHQLTTLELFLSKGLMDQFPFTSFLVDQFLNHLPQLENLSLTGANVQVTYKNYADLDMNTFSLKKLELIQSKVENQTVVFLYLSACCPQLNQVVFRKCETNQKKKTDNPLLNSFTLDLRHCHLEKIVLSTVLIYVGTIQSNEFIGIKIINTNNKEEEEEKTVWCSANKSMGNYIYPTYTIIDDQDKNMELDKIYTSYSSSPHQKVDIMPGNYTPTLGFFTVYCRSVSHLFLDNLKLSLLA